MARLEGSLENGDSGDEIIAINDGPGLRRETDAKHRTVISLLIETSKTQIPFPDFKLINSISKSPHTITNYINNKARTKYEITFMSGTWIYFN